MHTSKRLRQDAIWAFSGQQRELISHVLQPPVQPSPGHPRLFSGSTGGSRSVFFDLFLPLIMEECRVNCELNDTSIDMLTEPFII